MRESSFVWRLGTRFPANKELTIDNRDPTTSTDLKMIHILFGLGLIAVVGLLI